MEELQYYYFEVQNVKAGQIIQITQDGVYKVINHSFIENHSIETEKEKIPIVPGVLILESLFDYFGLDLLNQPYEAEFNSFLKPEDIVNFYFSGNEYGIKKQKENVVKLKKLDKCECPNFNFSQKTIKTYFDNINHIENTGQLFQKDNFSLISEVYSYHLDKGVLQQQDLFVGLYNNVISNPFLLLEFTAQAASLMATNFLKEKIITLKNIQFEFKNTEIQECSPCVRGKITRINKKNAEIMFEICKDNIENIVAKGYITGNIISKKLLAKLLKK